MPCKDITELIEIVLDDDDCLKEYRFVKRTCGQGVGVDSLLLPALRGRSTRYLLDITAEEFLTEFPIEDELEEFLSLKHLFAIQSAMEVLTGKEPGGKSDAFSAADIVYDDGETRISGLIAIDVVTEKIEACGGCRGCGNARDKAKPTPRSKPRSNVPASVQ